MVSFPVKSIGSGKKTTVADDEVILWSSKNRDNVAWPKGFIAPRAGIYRIELTAFERDNRHDLRAAGKTFESTMAKPGRSNQSLPPERPRMAAIMAMTADQVHGYGGPSTGGRRVGMVQVADHMTTVHVECLLEAGENIFVHASDAPRIQV